MIDNEKYKEWMHRVIKDSGSKIADSKVYLSLFSEGSDRDPQCLLELGIAMMLDKPIVVVATEGVKIPENLRKVAVIVENVDSSIPSDMKRAMRSVGKVISEIAEKPDV